MWAFSPRSKLHPRVTAVGTNPGSEEAGGGAREGKSAHGRRVLDISERNQFRLKPAPVQSLTEVALTTVEWR
jgi:hypothetical protein